MEEGTEGVRVAQRSEMGREKQLLGVIGLLKKGKVSVAEGTAELPDVKEEVGTKRLMPSLAVKG